MRERQIDMKYRYDGSKYKDEVAEFYKAFEEKEEKEEEDKEEEEKEELGIGEQQPPSPFPCVLIYPGQANIDAIPLVHPHLFLPLFPLFPLLFSWKGGAHRDTEREREREIKKSLIKENMLKIKYERQHEFYKYNVQMVRFRKIN